MVRFTLDNFIFIYLVVKTLYLNKKKIIARILDSLVLNPNSLNLKWIKILFVSFRKFNKITEIVCLFVQSNI